MPTPYPNVPAGFALARYHFTTPAGTGHALLICGHNVEATPPNPVALANSLMLDYANNAFVGVSNEVSFDGVHVIWNHAGSLLEGDSTDTPSVGGIGSTPVPGNVSLLVHKSSGSIGRQHRGRLYVPGIPASWTDSSGSSVTNAHLTTYQDAFTAWLEQLVTDQLSLVILHRAVGVVPDVVSSLDVRQLLATQRRRLRKAAHR